MLQHGQKTWTAVALRKPGGAETAEERDREVGRSGSREGSEADAGDDKDEKAAADADADEDEDEDEKADALDDEDDEEAAAAEGMEEGAECDAAAASVETAADAPPCMPAEATPSPATWPAPDTSDPEPPATSGRKTTTRRSVRARATSSSSARGTLVHAPKPS
jgi:hypothetical protein